MAKKGAAFSRKGKTIEFEFGGDTREALPAGPYEFMISKKSEFEDTKAGDSRNLKLVLNVTEGKKRGSTVWDRINLGAKSKWVLEKVLVLTGFKAKSGAKVKLTEQKILDMLVGKRLKAVIRLYEYNGKPSNEVTEYLASSFGIGSSMDDEESETDEDEDYEEDEVDEDEDTEDEDEDTADEEDEEEEEEDEDEADEEDEDEEEAEEDDEDDALPDDDDEEVEDEEDEEEEEEEAPPPKPKRARKPAAKKAAPARRKTTRRKK